MEKLKNQLKGARRQLTVCITAVHQALDGDEELAVQSRVDLVERTALALAHLDELMSELLEQEEGDEAEKQAMEECRKAFSYQDRASQCVTEARLYLERRTTAQAATRSSTLAKPQVKLEKLTLPMFDGNILLFQSFWETFEARVHVNPSLHPH